MNNVFLELLSKIKTITPHYMNGDDIIKNFKYNKEYMTSYIQQLPFIDYNNPYNTVIV